MDKGESITISEWMARGNTMEYIKNLVSRLELVRSSAIPTTLLTKM